MFSILGVLVLVLLDIGCTRAECPHGWLLFDKSCYLFGSDNLSWYDASSVCRAHHSYLASVESMGENEFLRREAMARKNSFWIGGWDDIIEGEWIWTSNEKQLTFTDWSRNQPDNAHGNEDCLIIYQNYQFNWNDFPCVSQEKFICERKNLVEESSIVGR